MRLQNCTFVTAALVTVLTQLSALDPQLRAQPTTNCAPRPPGLVAWWPGDGHAFDVVGGQRGNPTNGATFAAGWVGQAFRFDGVDDVVVLPDTRSGPLDLTNAALTITAWISRGSTGAPPVAVEAIFDKFGGPSSAHTGYAFGLTNGMPGILLGTATGSDFVLFAGDVLPQNQWVHLAATCDGAAARLYVDGVERASAAFGGPLVHNEEDAALGNGNAGGVNAGFKGLIDECAVFNRGLTPVEIAAIYAAGTNGICQEALPPTILTSSGSQIVALGSIATLTVTASGTPPLAFQWLFNGTNLPGATESTLVITAAQANHSGSYSVVVSNASGTATSDAALVSVFPIPLENPVFVTANLTIDVSNTNYEGRSLAVIGATLTTGGQHALGALVLTNGARLTHPVKSLGGVSLVVTGDLIVCSGASISADSLGYQGTGGAGEGPGGGGGAVAYQYAGAGGGHGGRGGDSPGFLGGGTYGSAAEPTTWGSAGGGGYNGGGGAGGGAIRLEVLGSLTVDGRVSANGTDGRTGYYWGGSGGGAGGSIWLSAGNLNGTGIIEANGGSADVRNAGGGGGGGRIALYFDDYDFTGSMSVNGGTSQQPGGSGTVYTPPRPLVLSLSKQVLGFLESPFSVDEWTFNAVAGQQVRLEAVNRSASSIMFDLSGPEDWIGITNGTGQSGSEASGY